VSDVEEMTTFERRLRVVALCIAAPAIAAAVLLPMVEGYRGLRPAAPLFGDPPAQTIVEAIQRGNQGVEEAYRFIAAGQDPNRPILVNDPSLTGGRDVMVSPLMLAVATRNRNVVQMLMSFGARLDVPQNSGAICLARSLHNDAIVSILDSGDGAGAECSPQSRPADAPPLAPAD